MIKNLQSICKMAKNKSSRWYDTIILYHMSLFYYYIPFIALFELSHYCTNYMTNRIAIEIKKYAAEKSLIFRVWMEY